MVFVAEFMILTGFLFRDVILTALLAANNSVRILVIS